MDYILKFLVFKFSNFRIFEFFYAATPAVKIPSVSEDFMSHETEVYSFYIQVKPKNTNKIYQNCCVFIENDKFYVKSILDPDLYNCVRDLNYENMQIRSLFYQKTLNGFYYYRYLQQIRLNENEDEIN